MASQRVVDESLINELVLLDKANKNRKIQLMLISDNEEIKKLHYYIFSSAKDVEYYTIEDLSPDDISIVYEMDIIIYNREDENLKEVILQIIKAQKLDLKFFEISDNEYLRQKDRLIAHNSGVNKLFNKDFMIEEFVMSIEMHLKSNFYTKRLITLRDSNIVLESEVLFQEYMDELIDKKIYFSLLRYNYDSDTEIKNYNIQKMVREHDKIFYDDKNSIINFLILNTIPSFSKKMIYERIKNFSISLENIDALSAFDLIFEEK